MHHQSHGPTSIPTSSLLSQDQNEMPRDREGESRCSYDQTSLVWYHAGLLKVLVNEPILFPMSQDILQNMQGEFQPLVIEGHLPLVTCPISGRASAQEDFLREILKSSRNPGEKQLSQHTAQCGGNGIAGCLHPISAPLLTSRRWITIQLSILTHKLAMLLALTNASRCSELAALDLQFCSIQSEGARFVIPSPGGQGPRRRIFQ